MPWQLIESAQDGDTHLALYAKDGVYMIRANGLELMNGFAHDSETAFGRLAAEQLAREVERFCYIHATNFSQAKLRRTCDAECASASRL